MTPAVPPVQLDESPSADQLCSNVRNALQQGEQQRQQEQDELQREQQHQTPAMRDSRQQQQQQATADSINPTPNTTTRTLPVSLFIDDPTSPVAPNKVASTAAAGAVVLDDDDAEEFLYADTILSDDDEHWLSPTAVGHYGGGSGMGSDGGSEFTWDEDSIKPSEALTPALRGVHAAAVEVMRRSSRMFETLGKGQMVA